MIWVYIPACIFIYCIARLAILLNKNVVNWTNFDSVTLLILSFVPALNLILFVWAFCQYWKIFIAPWFDKQARW